MTTSSISAETDEGPAWRNGHPDAAQVLFLGPRLLEETVLQTYVDDLLTAQRRSEIKEYLSQMPDEAARARSFQEQNRRLHDLFDCYLAMPLPHELEILENRLLVSLAVQRREKGNICKTATIIAVVAVSFALGSLFALGVAANASEIFAGFFPDLW